MTDTVTVGRGFTRNLGNFESARYDASVTSEVKEGETLEEAYNRVRDFVDASLTADIEGDN